MKTKDDLISTWIIGIAILNDGRTLVVERHNSTMKAFSRRMKLQPSLSLLDGVWDIAILSDTEAVLGTEGNTCLVINIFGTCLHLTRTLPLSYSVYETSKFNDKLIAMTRDPSFAITTFCLTCRERCIGLYQKISRDKFYIFSIFLHRVMQGHHQC